MSILCKLGFHKFRTTSVKPLPIVLPRYPSPAYIQIRCMRCAKQSWWFRENYPRSGSHDPAVHGYPAHVMVPGYDSMHTDDCPGCIDWARRMNEHAALATSRSQHEGASS